ncbi:histidine phosphatase family protein [Pseudonocardia sp. N23]|uniref:histidine phosphatase family protein n=1 Tax=Pseudonocardia sp. N23 TaxID=1987376 RepID=UPI000BFE2F83|nr:histidine phosphatase family protein [Pseudonocardia sp. N23]GAY09214.1 putative phosphoglycerate mutase [Pseudonocardia sp. N23]
MTGTIDAGTDTGTDDEPLEVPVDGLRLVLVRHGQTDANAGHVLDTALPGYPLNPLGQEQALGVAGVLADWPVRAVFASKATRAQETAAPVAEAHGLPVTVLDGVHEISVGELEGAADARSRRIFEDVYDAWWGGDLGRSMPGGESAADVRDRALPVVDELARAADDLPPGSAIVLVSHGATIRIIAGALLGDTVETAYVPNTGRVVLVRDPGSDTGWTLQLWDSGPTLPGDVTAGATG